MDQFTVPSPAQDFPVVLVVKNPPANTGDIGDAGSTPASERFPGEGNDNPLQYSCLENFMDKGACWAKSMELQRVRDY